MTDAMYRMERVEEDRLEPFLCYRSKRDMRPAPQPLDAELALYLTLAPIAAEFETDPTSVQCFDLRLVEQAKWIVRKFEGRFGGWMDQNRQEVRRVSDLLAAANFK